MIREASVYFACAAPQYVQQDFAFPEWAHQLHITAVNLHQVHRPWYAPPCEHHVAMIERPRSYDIYVRPMPDEWPDDHSCAADDAILRVAGMLSACRRGRLHSLRFDERSWSYRVYRHALRCDVLELAEHLLRAVSPVLTINEIHFRYKTDRQLHSAQLQGYRRCRDASRAAVPPRDHYRIF
jgi:hypothetical protein